MGSFYVGVTLLFPFVAIRALGSEKETGALRLLVQLPYGSATLVAAKLVAIASAWLLCIVPALSALMIWILLGGHLGTAETLNLLAGHFLYALLIGAIALFATAIADNSATAAIITLAFTIGSWVLDFALAGNPGWLGWVSRLSLTQTLRTFEQGLSSISLVVGLLAAIAGFAALGAVWLPPGIGLRTKLVRSLICIVSAGLVVAAATRIRLVTDVTEDQRNSFPIADARALASLTEPLTVTVHLAPEDPRYVDLSRNVLVKLERVMPKITIRLAGDRLAGRDERYGEVEYALRRTHRCQPFDQSPRSPAAPLCSRRTRCSASPTRRGLSRLSARCRCTTRDGVVFRRPTRANRVRLVVEQAPAAN